MEKNPKKILIVCHHYPPHITGVGIIAHNQAKNLVVRGNYVTVITSDTEINERSAIMGGVNVIRVKALNFLEKIHAPFPIFSPTIIYYLFREVKKADVVHIHDAFYISSILAFLIAKIKGKPVLLTQHVAMVSHTSRVIIAIQKIVYSTYGYLIFKYSNLITVYNDRVGEYIANKGINKESIKRVPNGVDIDFYFKAENDEKIRIKKELGLDLNKKVVLFVGRFVPKKGFEKVLGAQDDKYQIVFVGGDTKLKNTDKTIFLGKLSKTDVRRAYQASDLFVLPSNSEGFPVSIQEAMSCGLPVITAKDKGYDSYNLDENLFIMLDNPNTESVKNAINELFSNQERLQKMSEYSRDYAVKNFSWDSNTDSIESIYHSLLVKNNNKNKIAFISDAIYDFNKGGKEKRLYDITKKLAASGFDVTVYCMKWWDGEKTYIKDGIKYEAISKYYPLYHNERRSIKQAIFFAISCLKLITKKFDYIDVDHIPHLVLFTTKFVCLVRRKKLIVTWHEVWGRKYWKKYLGSILGEVAFMIELVTSKFPNKIVSVSSHTTSQLKNILGVKSEIYTIPNAIDLDIINKTPASGGNSDVIFAGRLLANKNVDILIRAIKELSKDGIVLKTYILGDGPEIDSLKDLSKNLNLEEQVKFFGFVKNHSDLYALMKSSKVFVLPSSREGFGIVVIEANASGLPVVTVNVESNASKDLIIQGENGSVCDLDYKILAKTISNEISKRRDSQYYMEYSKKYDWNIIFPIIKNLYK